MGCFVSHRQCGFNRWVLNSKRIAYVHASCLLPLHINTFCWPLKVNMFQVKTSWTPSWPGHYKWTGTRGLPLSSYMQIPSSNKLLFRSSPIMHNWQLQECHHTHTHTHTYVLTHARTRTHTHTHTCLSTAQHEPHGLPKREGTEIARAGHHITRAHLL